MHRDEFLITNNGSSLANFEGGNCYMSVEQELYYSSDEEQCRE